MSRAATEATRSAVAAQSLAARMVGCCSGCRRSARRVRKPLHKRLILHVFVFELLCRDGRIVEWMVLYFAMNPRIRHQLDVSYANG
jgi:hypothetical protein